MTFKLNFQYVEVDDVERFDSSRLVDDGSFHRKVLLRLAAKEAGSCPLCRSSQQNKMCTVLKLNHALSALTEL